jgi:hypothetical protein
MSGTNAPLLLEQSIISYMKKSEKKRSVGLESRKSKHTTDDVNHRKIQTKNNRRKGHEVSRSNAMRYVRVMVT